MEGNFYNDLCCSTTLPKWELISGATHWFWPGSTGRPEVQGVNVAQPDPTQPDLINTQQTSADQPMFFQPKNFP